MHKRQILLDLLQSRFPIVERPYMDLGGEINCAEEEVLEQVRALIDQGLIRRIGPFFDSRRLGFKSTLVAAKVEPGKVDTIAHQINLFAEVTHNYLRAHPFNLWFTLIAPDKERIHEIITMVRSWQGVQEIYNLPSRRVFKVNADFSTLKGAPARKCEKVSAPADLDGREKELVRIMQDGIPIIMAPFESMAGELREESRWIIHTINEWLDSGIIRRFGAALRHHQAGFSRNAMVVWAVPEEDEEKTGHRFAECREVSHCYLRPAFPGFPWTLYTMIHARSSREMQNTLGKLKKKSGLDSFLALESAREFKKVSPRYF